MELLNFFLEQIWKQNFAAGIIGNLLASHLYDAGKAGSNRLGERLSALRQQGGVYLNHDLRRALLFAQCQSLVAVCEICLLEDYGTQPTMARAFLQSDDIIPRGLLSHIANEEVAFIAALRGEFARYASRVEQMPEVELNALLRLQAGDVTPLWASSREVSDAAVVAELRERATDDARQLLKATTVNKWLTGVLGTITQAIREQLGQPSQITDVPDKLLRRFETDWFDLVRVAFRETLKDGRFERAKRAFELDVLTQLGEDVPRRFDDLEEKLKQQDAKLDAVLVALQQLTVALGRSTSAGEQQQAFVEWLPQWQTSQTQFSRIEETAVDTKIIVTETAADVKVIRHLIEDGRSQAVIAPSTPEQKIEIARLPQLLTRDLFGRAAELKLLDDAWANPATHIVVFVAFGGTGKSALVNKWVRQIEQEKYRGAARVYAWSFWSQGSYQPQTSADPFIDAALRWFDDPDPTAGSPWDKGERLARYIKQTRTLLILDGLEPLQHPPGPMEGQLKEQTMQALLRELAAGQPGLCVISTREPIADLIDYAAPAVVSHDLDQLSPQAGAQILREQKIEGDDAELEQASADFGNHALALTILSSLLKDAYGGDIRRRKEIPALGQKDDRKGRHALRVMASYEKWLSEAGEHSMLAVLRILGLFNRPAEAASIAALRTAPAIPGLTDALQALSEAQWQQTLAKLRRIKLLAERPAQASRGAEEELDVHALVREHFGQQLRERLPDAWREANNRLYEHLTRTAKELPETVKEMAPLFAAIAHGCAAGRHQEALDDAFFRRIRRGNEHFAVNKLGAWGADLAALAGFFAAPWQQPVAELKIADQAFVLNVAGFGLRTLGRLLEAAQPMQAGLAIRIAREDWKNAATIASNLSELYLVMGNLPQSLACAQQSVELADRSGDSFWRIGSRTSMADALHQSGRLTEAETGFRTAEALQEKRQFLYPILHSLAGFSYCELLLEQGKTQEVITRARQMLEWEVEERLRDIALDNLALGRASLRQATGAGEWAEAAEFLQRAVNGLRQAGMLDYLPRGLLARAEMYRLMGDSLNLGRAQTDLAEAQRIAERGEMGLHLCDCHLEWARLNLAQGDPTLAREHWATAKAMIERMGYHRRDKDVEEIEQQLAGLQTPPTE